MIGNDVLRQFDLFVTKYGAEFKQKKIQKKPKSKKEVNTKAVKSGWHVGSAELEGFFLKSNVVHPCVMMSSMWKLLGSIASKFMKKGLGNSTQ